MPSKEEQDDPTPNARLLDAAAKGDVELIERLVSGDEPEANPDCARAPDGATPLMLAAEGGHAAAVAALLRAGAAWNALDAEGHCAGEYSSDRDVTQMLMQWGVEMEELLIEREEEEARGRRRQVKKRGEAAAAEAEAAADEDDDNDDDAEAQEERESRDYLAQRLAYDDADPSGARLLDANGDAVMMGWEAPLMARHADALCCRPAHGDGKGGDDQGNGGGKDDDKSDRPEAGLAVINIGYGLGIIDRDLQRHRPRRHVIVEAHPDVLARIDAEGWPSRPGVTVLRGRWEDVLLPLPPSSSSSSSSPDAPPSPIADILASGGFDAVYWDTYAQHARQLRRFHDDVLPRLLRRPSSSSPSSRGGPGEGGDGGGGRGGGGKEGGRYSWFNGVGSDNAFFHAVSTQVIARGLARGGFRTAFERFSVGELGDEVWRGVARSYWGLPFYLMPLVRWQQPEQDEQGQEEEEARGCE